MKKVISILTLLLLCFPAYSQDESLTDSQTEQKSKEIEIYSDQGSNAINDDLYNNSEQPEEEIAPLLALKTNLLFDLVTAVNLEIEVPIGKHFSIAGEWVFPWWTSGDDESSDRNCFQLLNGNIEGKYWFGDRTNRAVMTGWYVGLYAGGGLYDLEYEKEGYQGEFFIAAGVSGGFAHTINKSGSLRMEYSVAVGYLKTDYNKYAEHLGIDNTWHTLRQESGNYTWIGPTRAKVSLVWMLNRKRK